MIGFRLLDDRTFILLVIIVLSLYLAYLVVRKFARAAKSSYDREIERILASDKHKVRGKFE